MAVPFESARLSFREVRAVLRASLRLSRRHSPHCRNFNLFHFSYTTGTLARSVTPLDRSTDVTPSKGTQTFALRAVELEVRVCTSNGKQHTLDPRTRWWRVNRVRLAFHTSLLCK